MLCISVWASKVMLCPTEYDYIQSGFFMSRSCIYCQISSQQSYNLWPSLLFMAAYIKVLNFQTFSSSILIITSLCPLISLAVMLLFPGNAVLFFTLLCGFSVQERPLYFPILILPCSKRCVARGMELDFTVGTAFHPCSPSCR